MTKDKIIRMANEANLWLTSEDRINAVNRFAELVAAAERKKYFSNLQGEALLGEYSVQLIFESHKNAKIAINAIRDRGANDI